MNLPELSKHFQIHCVENGYTMTPARFASYVVTVMGLDNARGLTWEQVVAEVRDMARPVININDEHRFGFVIGPVQ